MDNLKRALIEIWTTDIPEQFNNGLLTYERQLQARLYYLLKLRLSKNYNIWIEPVIYIEKTSVNKSKPDIFVTKDDIIVGIIELKFKPWEEPAYLGDIEKLISFDKKSNEGIELSFGFIPISHDWVIQKNGKKISYKLTPDHLNVFIVFGKKNCNAFELNNIERPNNFLHLWGHIDTLNIFNFKDYNKL